MGIQRRPRIQYRSKLPSRWGEKNAKARFTYEMLLQRELEQDAMLWQTPTIALTAQAFLLTIALNPAVSTLATYLSAGLGLLVALLSMQLMAKHRFLNLMDRVHLHALEADLEIEHLSNRQYFYTNGAYRIPDRFSTHKAPRAEGGLARLRSYRVWIFGLLIFAAVNVAIVVVQIWAPELLDVPSTPRP